MDAKATTNWDRPVSEWGGRSQFTSRDELAAAVNPFGLAYDEHGAKPYRRAYDGSPLKAT
jgi:hypothetical protein